MLAQWISWAQSDGCRRARTEPLITLGSAPLDVPDFSSVVLGQLGEARLATAIDADIAGVQAHARSLDADTKGALRDIHRRTGTTILFESSGGQVDRVAHLPELRFALGEPTNDTTSIDAAALALEERSYFLRRVGTDGFRISYRPTIRKVVNDRRAALDEEGEILPAVRSLVKTDFDQRASMPRVYFPADGTTVPDTPRLTVVVVDPETEWTGKADDDVRKRLAEWTRTRGTAPRLYPGALVWTLKKPGRELRGKVEQWLAWKRVAAEISAGALGTELEKAEVAEIRTNVTEAGDAAREEVWGDYRFVVIADNNAPDGLRPIDLGAGHSSNSESLCGRVISALKSEALLNESVGARYIERNWPPAFKEDGAWPLSSLRQSFLDGSLTRLLNTDDVLVPKIVQFVDKSDFGLGSGRQPDGTFDRVAFGEAIDPADVTFDANVYLLSREAAEKLRREPEPESLTPSDVKTDTSEKTPDETEARAKALPSPNQEEPDTEETTATQSIRIHGEIPSESWNRIGTKLVTKLRGTQALKVGVSFDVTAEHSRAPTLLAEVRQILDELQLGGDVRIDVEEPK